MQYNDSNDRLHGHWRLDVYRGDVRNINTLERVIEGDNRIVTVGKGLILDRAFGLSAVGAMTRIGVGTSSTADADGNTGLTGGTGNGPGGGGTFKVFDSAATRASLVVTAITTFTTAEANIVWAELGMDNGTTLLNRIAPIGPFTKSSAVSIVVTVTITQS